MAKFKRHALSAEFGDMPEAQFIELRRSIERDGLQHPILIWQDQVIDGWHRYQACLKAKVEPTFESFKGDEQDAVTRVLIENLHRRNLTEGRRVTLAKRFHDWHAQRASEGRPKKTPSGDGVKQPTVTQADIAKAANVGQKTVERHTYVENNAPALMPAVERGDIGLKAAEKIARTVAPEVIRKSSIDALVTAVAELPESRIKRIQSAVATLEKELRALKPLLANDKNVHDEITHSAGKLAVLFREVLQ